MSNTPLSSTELAARLATALAAQDALSCEQAEAMLPSLLEAEQAGASVERDPAFTALLRHLDHCEGCLDLYAQLGEDLEAVMGEADVLPTLMPAAPTFFEPPIRKGDHVLLEVARGLVRRFTLIFDLPRLAPAVATLGGPQRSLYSDTLHEVAGTPLLAVVVGSGPEGLWLQVAVREAGQNVTWRLQLTLGDIHLTAITNERGLARFSLPANAPLGEVRLQCEELRAEEQNE